MSRNIALFTPAIDAFGGVERLILELSRYLHQKRLTHHVVCLSNRVNLAGYADWPLQVVVLDAPRRPVSEACIIARHFQQALYRTPLFFDLKAAFYAGLAGLSGYHLHLTDPPSLLPTDLSKFAFSIGGGEASPLMRMRSEVLHQVNRRGVRRAVSLIAMTNCIADELEGLYARRPNIINPGIVLPTTPPRMPPSGPGTIRFLSVSRLETSKRIDWIMLALKGLEADWSLDVVGAGSEGELLRCLSEKLGIQKRVKFHGRLSDAALEAQFARADTFLMPAVQGYGLPALEALVRGVPVILHRDSGVSEVLENGPWVQTITEGADDLASAIRLRAESIRSGALLRSARPAVPTAEEWAQKIAVNCGWEDCQ